MSPCASDSAELPPCRTEQVRHHCLNPGSIPKTSLPPLSPCFTLSPTNLPLGLDRTKHSPAVPLPGPGALLHVSDKIMV